jgi:8-oxo-dGTP diphosphatase
MFDEPLQVTAAVLKRRGRFFLARRSPEKHQAGFWEFPGGKIESGETPEACLMREMREEFGIRVVIHRHLITCTHHYPERVVTLLAFATRHVGGRFHPTSHDALGWFTRKEISALQLAPADVPIAQAVGVRFTPDSSATTRSM